MEDRFEEKLNEYICCYCADKTSDLDFAIGQLSTAIGTFEREAKKRKEKARKQLIDNFKDAYNALKKAEIVVSVEINPEDVDNAIDWSFEAEINDVNKFVFGCY
jgi:hypothetical protein